MVEDADVQIHQVGIDLYDVDRFGRLGGNSEQWAVGSEQQDEDSEQCAVSGGQFARSQENRNSFLLLLGERIQEINPRE
jgi:invasion protein IalB